MSGTAQLFQIGDRVEFIGPEIAYGTVTSVRESERGFHYRVDWDDGAQAPEMSDDELRRPWTSYDSDPQEYL